MATYCSSEDVANFLQVPLFTASTTPTNTQVEDLIENNEDYIDSETMHSWRETTISEETHHLEFPEYQLRDGTSIFLNHRLIKTFNSSTDKIEVWNGESWEDYLTTRTEGRNQDFWVDYKMGILFIKSFPRTVPRNFAVRVTYRFGEDSVPRQIKKCCILLTALDILQSEDRTILFPEGSSNLPYTDKAERWEKQALQIISSNKEVKVIGL